jgi:hypothetical protein
MVNLPLRLEVVNPPAMADIVMRCASDEFELRDREGRDRPGLHQPQASVWAQSRTKQPLSARAGRAGRQ